MKSLRFISSALFLVAIGFGLSGQTKKPIFIRDPETNKYGYRSDYRGEWLTPIEYEFYGGSDFKDKDYAIVKKNGKFNVINLNLTPVLPEWSDDYIQVVEGLVVVRSRGLDVLYDLSGKKLLASDDIRHLVVVRYNHSLDEKRDPKREEHLIGFSVAASKNGPFYLYDVNGKRASNLTSVSPITSSGGILLFTKGPSAQEYPRWKITGGTVTDAMGNVLDEVNGYTQILSLTAGTGKTAEYVATQSLYDGYMPCYVLQATDNYKGKGNGVIAGHEIVKKFGFKSIYDVDENKKAAATKVFRQPEMVAVYKSKVLAPLEQRLKLNRNLLANVAQRPTQTKARVIKYGDGYAMSTDGTTPMQANNRVYRSITPIGKKGLLLAYANDKAQLLGNTGMPVVSDDRLVDFAPLGKDEKYIAGIRNDGALELFDDMGNAVGSNIYDEIIPTQTAIGEVFYVVRHNKWGAWAPGYKDRSPKLGEYHYVGLPNSSGEVEVRYNGFPGTYNLKTSEERTPVKTLFDVAYDDHNGMSASRRVATYLQVIELDKELRDGYTGAALNNIGSIYENAGDEDTAYSYYERSMNAGNKTGEKNYKRIRNNRRLDRVAAIAGAIAGAAQSAVNIMAGVGNAGNITAYNAGYGDVNQLNSDRSSGSGYSASFYQEQYNNWERRAQSAYESLTNLGVRAKRNGTEVSGSTLQSMSGSNYTRQKKCLRDAQNEMRSIRTKARKDGVNINQSHWETVTVSY